MRSKARNDGFCIDVEVRKTPDKGLGVFAREPVEQGGRVWRFVTGHFDVYDEAGFLRLIDGMAHDDAVYELTHMFAFEDFPTCIIRVRDDGALINHASKANLATNFARPLEAVRDADIPHTPERVTLALQQERFALVATRDIAAGEELTNNYNEDIFDPDFFIRVYDTYNINEDYLDEDA
ncbi:MAG: SET domain-containing protein [Pseudomonadota bacterium]